MLKIEPYRQKIAIGAHEDELTFIAVNGIINDRPTALDGTFQTEDENIIKELSKYSLNEIKEHFDVLTILVFFEGWEALSSISFHLLGPSSDKPFVCVDILFESDDWAKSFSVNEFRKAIQEYMTLYSTETGCELMDDILDDGCTLYSKLNSLDGNFGSELERMRNTTNEIIAGAKTKALELINKESIVMYFRFPENIKTASQQYLVYFIQFLEDLGINANADIIDEIGQTLFKVTPVDKEKALDKIRDALNLYLNAPSSTCFNGTLETNDIAVLQWQANVLHLKSQLALAGSVIEAKQATIESLKLTNYQLAEIVKQSEKSKQESIIKDVVAVKKYEGKVLVIDWPKILKKLKRTCK